MSRLINPAIDMLSPSGTAARLLRIMLSVKLLPVIVGAVVTGAQFGSTGAAVLLISWPTMLAWLLLMMPGLERRLGKRYLPIGLIVTIAAQTIESSLSSFAVPSFEGRIRPFGLARSGVPLEVRFVEPLFLLMVAVVIGAWVYGKRGAWTTAGLCGVLMIIGSATEYLIDPPTRLIFDSDLSAVVSPWPIVSTVALRIPLLIVIGFIVGTLAELERNQTRALSTANAQLRDQADAIEQLATARERNRLARDLHDTLAHSLAGLVVQLQAIDTLMPTETETARSELAKAHELAQTGLKEARHAIQDLRASPIEDLGLARALERAALDFGERAEVKVDLHVEDPRATLSNEVAAQVLRIAQEAFNNIERHADAQCVAVALIRNDGHLILRVSDDGRGFADASVSDDRFGLTGMRERAEMIGGDLTVTSAVGQGTVVQLTMSNGQ